ncbi:MAG: hypothetical protein ACRC3I_12095 [Cetobacterium sp.]
MVNIDFRKIGYIVNKFLMNRIGKPSGKKDKKHKLFSAKKKVQKEEKQTEIIEIEDPQIRVVLIFQRNSTCEVTGKYIGENDNFYVHRLVPKEHGRSDDLENLMLLDSTFKTLLKS